MSEHRSIRTLPLSETFVNLLIDHGFRYCADLTGCQPLDLSQELGVSLDDAVLIKQAAAPPTGSLNEVSVKDLLLKSETDRIITLCKTMDELLGGGIAIGQITEICGVPGIGKTQLSMQLAMNAQIPAHISGAGGETIYIDTEGSFVIERAAEMAESLSTHLMKLTKRRSAQSSNTSGNHSEILPLARGDVAMEKFLEGIHLFRAHDQTELLAILQQLQAFIAQRQSLGASVKLIVLDSIAFHFRQDIQEAYIRARILSNVAQTLNRLAYTFKLAVVVTNHVTTRLDKGLGIENTVSFEHVNATLAVSGKHNNFGDISRIVPALGEQWSHCVTNRLLLHWGHYFSSTNEASQLTQSSIRFATLVKSPSKPPGTIKFSVCSLGIRDVMDNMTSSNGREDSVKRPRLGDIQQV